VNIRVIYLSYWAGGFRGKKKRPLGCLLEWGLTLEELSGNRISPEKIHVLDDYKALSQPALRIEF
jgi:hypothetical protein